MPTSYCKSCGSGTLYTLKSPKFCGACGQPFDAPSMASLGVSPISQPVLVPTVFTRPTPDRLQPKPKYQIVNEDGEEDDAGIRIPEISKIEVNFSVGEMQKEKFGEVIKQQKTGFDRPIVKRGRKKASTLLAEECSSSRGKETSLE